MLYSLGMTPVVFLYFTQRASGLQAGQFIKGMNSGTRAAHRALWALYKPLMMMGASCGIVHSICYRWIGPGFNFKPRTNVYFANAATFFFIGLFAGNIGISFSLAFFSLILSGVIVSRQFDKKGLNLVKLDAYGFEIGNMSKEVREERR